MAAVVRLHRWGDARYGGFALKAGLNAACVLAERRVRCAARYAEAATSIAGAGSAAITTNDGQHS